MVTVQPGDMNDSVIDRICDRRAQRYREGWSEKMPLFGSQEKNPCWEDHSDSAASEEHKTDEKKSKSDVRRTATKYSKGNAVQYNIYLTRLRQESIFANDDLSGRRCKSSNKDRERDIMF